MGTYSGHFHPASRQYRQCLACCDPNAVHLQQKGRNSETVLMALLYHTEATVLKKLQDVVVDPFDKFVLITDGVFIQFWKLEYRQYKV